MKSKKCRVCREQFKPQSSFQVVCSQKCALAMVKKDRAKKERKELMAARERLKTKGDYAKEAQVAFNAYIRERDRDLPCVSCGRHHQGVYDAGHYRSVGSTPELRFEPDNCHKQCVPCNRHKSGDIINFRQELIRRLGAERVEWLEGPHEPKHYTIEQLKELKKHFRKLARDLKNGTK